MVSSGFEGGNLSGRGKARRSDNRVRGLAVHGRLPERGLSGSGNLAVSVEDDPRPIFETAASKDSETWAIIDRHLHKLRKTKQPFMDHVMVGCACDILRTLKPDVMFIHLAHLDHTRHANGIQGPMIEQAIVANDDWLGRLFEATMDTRHL